MKFLFTCLPIWLLACVALAVNSMDQGFLCPICGTHWEQRVETSGHSRGLRLDLRQLGDVVDPPTLPQCTKCRFPLFNEQLLEQAQDPAKEKAFKRLRTFVLGADFQMLAAKNPSYFALALVQAVIGDERHPTPHRYLALSYLRASWQVEDRPAACRRSLEKALEHYVAALDETDAQDRRRGDLALLCGEIERRLEKWDEAESRFRELESSALLHGTPRAAIPGIQLKLIARRDSAPHTLDGGEIAVKRPPPEREVKFENPGQISMESNRAETPAAMTLELPPQNPISELPPPTLTLEPRPGPTLALGSPADAASGLGLAPSRPAVVPVEKSAAGEKPPASAKAADMELPSVLFVLPEPALNLPSAPSATPEDALLPVLPAKSAASLPPASSPLVKSAHVPAKTTPRANSPDALPPTVLPVKLNPAPAANPDDGAKTAPPAKAPALPPAPPVKPTPNFSDNPD